ncbi:Vps45p [Sporobolomyces salmoneus]|uniref:Vps45p n=1 Tax=Sporobolomyces salmoneus TaxID=183962 RepID=UPI00317C592B
MDCLKAVQTYLDKIVTNTRGIKVLLLDQDTTPIVSLVTTQSNLLQHEIYLTDRIDNPSRRSTASSSALPGASAYPPTSTAAGGAERLPHLNCIVILRPTEESIQACENELQEARYGGYWLYFTNCLTKMQIERLAEADRFELVQEVQEYFLDYSPLTPSHFSLSLLPTPLHPSPTYRTYPLYGSTPSEWSPSSPSYQLHLSQLTALLLSLKKKPIIRYERMSSLAHKLGRDLLNTITTSSSSNEGGEGGGGGLFDFRRSEKSPILIILDRRNDPVTPLLTQWTYQGMVHEELGIVNGRVSLQDAPDVREELKELVLSPDQDPFFKKTMYDNFGDLGAHLSEYVNEYGKSSQVGKQLETVKDMKRFIDEYPEFRKLGSNVSKHVALVGELSRLVEKRKLLEISELEQSLAANESHSQDLRAVQAAIESGEEVSSSAKLRLAILYALRYQKLPGNQIGQIVELLRRQGVEDAEMVNIMLGFAGSEQRQDDLFSNENIFSRGKSALKGLKGVENVYTQHKPHLAETLDLLLRGRLKESSYPFIEGQHGHPASAQPSSYAGGSNAQQGSGGVYSRPQDVILFMIGGTTYEEARYVAQLNAQFESGQGLSGSVGPSSGVGSSREGGNIGVGMRILLGGTCVHNSKTFLQMVRDASFSFPAPTYTSATSNLSHPASSSAFSAPPTTTSNYSQPPSTSRDNYALNIGPVSLNVDHRVGNTLEAATDAARDGLKDLFGKVRSRVDGVRLN